MVKSLKWFGVIFVGSLFTFLLYDHVLKDRLFPKRFGEVAEGVYRSGQIHPRLIEQILADKQISKVIDLRYWEELPEMLAERDAISKLGIEGERYPLNGNGTGNVEHYIAALLSLHESVQAGEPVLVHCAAGSQRTGGVFAAYRTLVQGVPADQAVAEMQQYDWDPKKDQVLLDYLNQHIGRIALELSLAGVIAEVPAQLPVFVNPLN
jgi:protein tyrosine/serine phosphatase